MKIVVRLPRHHDKIPASRSRKSWQVFATFVTVLCFPAGIAILCWMFTAPEKSITFSHDLRIWVVIAFYGAGGILIVRGLFEADDPVGSGEVILDEDGVRHPDHEQLVQWRDITQASLRTVRKSGNGPEVAMLCLGLIDDPVRNPGRINIRASPDDDSPIPATIDFTLEHSPAPPEEVLAFALEKIAAYRACLDSPRPQRETWKS